MRTAAATNRRRPAVSPALSFAVIGRGLEQRLHGGLRDQQRFAAAFGEPALARFAGQACREDRAEDQDRHQADDRVFREQASGSMWGPVAQLLAGGRPASARMSHPLAIGVEPRLL